MSVLCHPGKANVVEESRTRLYVGRVAHVEDKKKKLARKFHTLP